MLSDSSIDQLADTSGDPAYRSEFRDQMRYLVLDRLLREEKALADLPIGAKIRDQIARLTLALGESGEQLVRERSRAVRPRNLPRH